MDGGFLSDFVFKWCTHGVTTPFIRSITGLHIYSFALGNDVF